MIDTTTPKDLAKKIEWIGLRNLSFSEKERVREELVDVSSHLPRLLALALWSYFGKRPPEYMVTRGSDSSLRTYREREQTKSYIKDLMSDYREED